MGTDPKGIGNSLAFELMTLAIPKIISIPVSRNRIARLETARALDHALCRAYQKTPFTSPEKEILLSHWMRFSAAAPLN